MNPSLFFAIMQVRFEGDNQSKFCQQHCGVPRFCGKFLCACIEEFCFVSFLTLILKIHITLIYFSHNSQLTIVYEIKIYINFSKIVEITIINFISLRLRVKILKAHLSLKLRAIPSIWILKFKFISVMFFEPLKVGRVYCTACINSNWIFKLSSQKSLQSTPITISCFTGCSLGITPQ